MKKVLITGAAGFIGSHLCDKFINERYYVIGIDNFLTGKRENITHILFNKNFQFIEYDVTNYLFLQDDIELILHFACPASPVDYLKYPIQTMKVDSIGTLNALELALLKKARFVFASTSEIYGDPLIHPQVESYWGNVNTLGLRAVYDEAKRFSESLIMAYHRKYSIDVRIARIFNTYGPRMRIDDGRVVPNFIKQALLGQNLTVYGDGSQTRSFCYIDDLVEGVYRLATFEDLDGTVVNLGNPDEYKIIDFAKIVLDKVGSKSKIVYKPLPQDDPRKRKPNIARAFKLLGWEPRVSLEKGLNQTINYFRSSMIL